MNRDEIQRACDMAMGGAGFACAMILQAELTKPSHVPMAWVLDCPGELDEFLNHDERSIVIFDPDHLSWDEYEGWKVTPLYRDQP